MYVRYKWPGKSTLIPTKTGVHETIAHSIYFPQVQTASIYPTNEIYLLLLRITSFDEMDFPSNNIFN